LNVNILSVDELVKYIESGVIENVPSERVLEIIREFQEQIDVYKQAQDDYDKGYRDGVDECIERLDCLR